MKKEVKMKKVFIWGIALSFVFITACSENIPKPVNDLIFKNPKFLNITFSFGCGKLGFGNYVDIKDEWMIEHGLLTIKKGKGYYHAMPAQKIIPHLISPDTIQEDKYNTCKVLLAVRELKSVDYKKEYEKDAIKIYALTFSYTVKDKVPFYEEWRNFLATTKRVLWPKPVWLRRSLPEELNKVHKGKAQAYLDPNDGVWKLAELKLEVE
jgi:hypothetical protein